MAIPKSIAKPHPSADPPGVPARKQALVYADGFTLYFGILQGSLDLKWLNLESFDDRVSDKWLAGGMGGTRIRFQRIA